MSWVAVGGAAVGVVGNALTKDKNGGAGTTTSSKDPWIGAAPWLEQLLSQGQGLSTGYFTNPFSARQEAAYNNQYALSDAMKNQIPSLLMQLQTQPTGFDPSKGNASSAGNAQKGWDWASLFNGGLLNQQRGLLSLGAGSASIAPQAAAAPAPMPSPDPGPSFYIPAGGA